MALKDIVALTEKTKKDYEHGIVRADANTLIHKICFDSPQLTYMFSGFSYDRIHQCFGPESSGKSSLYTYIASQLQKKMPEEMVRLAQAFEDEGRKEEAEKIRKDFKDKQFVIYLDFEGTFDPSHAEQIGLNMDEEHFALFQPDSIEDGFTMIEPYVKSGSVCCVILDSDAAATTNLDNESDFGSTGFNGAKDAAVLTMVYKKFNVLCRNYLTPLLVVSQERANMNIASHLPSQTGANAIKFYSTTRNRITKIDTLKNKDGIDAGIQMRVRNYKNKAGVPWRDAIMNLWFDGGFNSDDEYFDFFVIFDFIHKGNGGVYTADFLPNGKIRGAEKVKEWIMSDEAKDIYKNLKEKVTQKLLGNNELDAENINPESSAEIEKNDISKIKVSISELAEQASDLASGTSAEEVSPDLGLE